MKGHERSRLALVDVFGREIVLISFGRLKGPLKGLLFVDTRRAISRSLTRDGADWF